MGGHAGGGGASAAAGAYAARRAPPIESMQVSGNRLILKVKTARGEEIDIFDTADGHLVSPDRRRARPKSRISRCWRR